jgi:hypothetical protein
MAERENGAARRDDDVPPIQPAQASDPDELDYLTSHGNGD